MVKKHGGGLWQALANSLRATPTLSGVRTDKMLMASQMDGVPVCPCMEP